MKLVSDHNLSGFFSPESPSVCKSENVCLAVCDVKDISARHSISQCVCLISSGNIYIR